jgi:hypothetical protein
LNAVLTEVTGLPLNYAADIAEAARRFSIPESWIRAVMHVESRGQVKAVSPKGAIGLMQIMPDTWAGLRLRYRLGRDLRDPHRAGREPDCPGRESAPCHRVSAETIASEHTCRHQPRSLP